MWWWWRYCCGASISCQIVGRLQRPLPIRTVLVVITIVSVSVVISAYIILSSCPSNHSLHTPHPTSRLFTWFWSYQMGKRIHQLIEIVGKGQKKPLKCGELRINQPTLVQPCHSVQFSAAAYYCAQRQVRQSVHVCEVWIRQFQTIIFFNLQWRAITRPLV